MLKRLIWCLTILLSISSQVHSQTWERLTSRNGNFTVVYFPHFASDLSLGFAAFTEIISSSAPPQYKILRTTDGGKTWIEPPVRFNTAITSIVFKDATTGWLSTGSLGEGGVYKTIDGGNNWTKLSLNAMVMALHYQPQIRRLFASTWDDFSDTNSTKKSFYSDDEGATWKAFAPTNLNGYAFTDDQTGIISCLAGPYQKTTDGGLTWKPLVIRQEAWQAVGFKGTQTYVIASEHDQKVYRSEDGAETWRPIFDFQSRNVSITGCLKGTSCALVAQGWNIHKTMFLSTDGGFSWQSIGGPSAMVDTRFDVIGRNIYACETAPFNDPSPRSIWRFVLPLNTSERPQLTNTIELHSSVCDRVDTSIAITMSNCYDNVLKSITLSDSLNFSIVSPALPYILKAIDSLRIRYSPTTEGTHTCKATISFLIGDAIFDTTITINGIATPAVIPTLSFDNSSADIDTVEAGKTLQLSLFLPQEVNANPTLTNVSLTLGYNTDVLTFLNAIQQSNWIIETKTTTTEGTTLSLRYIGQHPPDVTQPIATLQFLANIAQAPSTSFRWKSVSLDGVSIGANCLTTQDSLVVYVGNSCGDDLLRNFMKGKLNFQVLSIRPNPALRNNTPLLTIDLQTHTAAEVAFTLQDINGKVICKRNEHFDLGRHTFLLQPEYSLSEGVYFLKIESQGSQEIRKIYIQSAR